MRYYPLVKAAEDDALEADRKISREIGQAAAGECFLFIRRMLKVYYISYADITRVFRRVSEVPAKIGCCSGSYDTESLVVCTGEEEIVEIPLPDTRSAKALLEELKEKIPHAEFACPK